MELSDDQQAALDIILPVLREGKPAILTGAAGTGKTTLVTHMLSALPQRAVIACPTGKAAQRAHVVTGCSASTIHRLMFGTPEEVSGEPIFTSKNEPLSSREHFLIVDEASMLGSKLYDDLMSWVPPKMPILFVGDREQLEPVRDTWGVDLLNPTAALTQVHRQALGNPIISYATAIRHGEGDAWLKQADVPEVKVGKGLRDALQWHLECRTTGKDSTLLTYTHDVRRQANTVIRNALGFTRPIEVGDRLVVKTNNAQLGLMNGEVVNVTEVRYNEFKMYPKILKIRIAEKKQLLYLSMDLLERDSKAFWDWKHKLSPKLRNIPFIHVWYGDCLTVHSAQGSAWDNVAFLWDGAFKRMRSKEPESARRFLYTAVTRAVENVGIYAC